MLLGVNIDHIAVLREARKINNPDPLDALGIVKRAGADQITIHLREDRRHINDVDAMKITENSPLPVNIESSINPEIIEIIMDLRPHRVTLVPEKREEVTTEGGLDVVTFKDSIKEIAKKLKNEQIELSLFIDPKMEQIEASQECGAQWIELHTGHFANIYAMLFSNLKQTPHSIESLDLPRDELRDMLNTSIKTLRQNAQLANTLGLKVAAGHGLNYQNLTYIKEIDEIIELNIGQSIIARSVYDGLENAVKDMIKLLK